MNSKTRKIIFNVILILATIVFSSYLVVFFIKSYTNEPFTNLTPGNYPCTVDTIPLEGWYTAKKDANVSDKPIYQQYKDYPVYSADSTENNNKRLWESPDNGKCTPSDFCGEFYEKQHVVEKGNVPPPTGNGKRVNYYDSTKD